MSMAATFQIRGSVLLMATNVGIRARSPHRLMNRERVEVGRAEVSPPDLHPTDVPGHDGRIRGAPPTVGGIGVNAT
jgi:hypothetical protein